MLTAPIIQRHESVGQAVHPEFMSSGAYRTTSYQAWLELRSQSEPAPERKPDGTHDGGISHAAESPDEIIEHFRKMGEIIARSAGPDPTSQAEAQKAQNQKELAELGKRAATGDADAMQEAVRRSLEVLRATDPNILPQPYVSPADFAAQFPIPLDTTELITLCEETGLWRAFPEIVNGSNTESWRELNQLDFLTGCSDIAFAPGECPEDFQHAGNNRTEAKRHIGVKKTLSDSDITHSAASIAAGYGMRELVGGFNDQGLPGERDVATFLRQNISDLKDKEARLGSVLVLNGWDQLLVDGDNGTNPLEFDGLVTQVTSANGARCNDTANTGTFSVTEFDQFLSAGCARPQAILGHPTALAAISLAYFAIGSQTVFFNDNKNVVPGLHFAGELMTGMGPIDLIADSRFARNDNGDGTFNATVYPVRLTHNGEPLIYRATQIPMSFKDLAPGCTAISFEIWAVTALVVKALCAQACYSADFSGLVDDGCTYIHPCIADTS